MLKENQNVRIISPEKEFNFVALPGQTVRSLVNQLPEWQDHQSLTVYNHGQEIKDLDNYFVNDGDRLIVCLVPMGGGGGGGAKGVIGIVAAIAIIAVAWWNPMGWAAAGGLLTTTTLYAIGAGVLLSSVGTLLAPRPSLGTSNSVGTSQRENSYFLTGQSNQARPFSPVLVCYGRNKVYPLIAANPNVINEGTTSTFDALYDFGIGDLDYKLHEIKFGDTLASIYNPEFYPHTNSQYPNLKLITNRYGYQDYSIKLEYYQGFIAQTKENTINAEVNITFPEGLAYIDNNGNTQTASCTLIVEWRTAGDGVWTALRASAFKGATVTQSGSTASPCAFGLVTESNTGNNFVVCPVNYQLDGRNVRSVNPNGVCYLGGAQYGLLSFEEFENTYIDLGDGNGYYVDDWVFKQICMMEPYELWVNGQPTPTPPGGRYTWQIPYVPAVSVTPYSDVTVTGATLAPFVLIAQAIFPEAGLYDIKITRTSQISTDNRRRDEAIFSLLESRVAGNVLNLSAPHSMLEMRVRANERLNGTVQNLSVITTSILNTYDEFGNVNSHVPTRNPAWIAIDILTGHPNPKPIRLDQIDWPAWKRLADICDEQRTWTIGTSQITTARFTCDVVVDYDSTVKELLESVLSTCRAGLTIGLNGRYSVMFDGERSIPRQVITPSNSWNFSASRQFIQDVHGIKVSFIDSNSDYKKQEIIVYRDGYNEANAEIFEDLGTFGITEYQHAWAFGRYQLASAIGRSEVFTVTMDVENLACQRGDLVHVAHDVPMIGGISAYVSEIAGNALTITEYIDIYADAYTVRQADGNIRQGYGYGAGNVFTVDNANGIEIGDLIVVGETERVVKEYIVAQIAPSLDLTASLTLLQYVPEVYDADIGLLPEWNPELNTDIDGTGELAITYVASSGQKLVYVDRMPFGRFIINWNVNQRSVATSYTLVITTADGAQEVIAGLANRRHEYTVDLIRQTEKFGNVTFEVTPFNSAGTPGIPGSTTDVITPDRIAPANVNWFLTNVQDMNIALAWEPPKEPDIGEFEIRYSPSVSSAVWNSSQLVGVFAHNVTRTMVGARTGTYMIAVRDTSGNLSNISVRRTTIQELPQINLLADVNDSPLWEGTLSDVEKEGFGIQSGGSWGAVNAEGFYYYKTIFDAGSVYELRIVSKIQSHGSTFDDYIFNWQPLASAVPLAQALSSKYNVMLEVRTSDQSTAMVDWTPLASAIPIGGSLGNVWSAWRPCEVGDFTGRLFQFRLRLQSFDPYVRAVIDDGLVQIDVRDRIDRFHDVYVPSSGIDFTYTPAFMDTPTLAVTTENTTAIRHVIRNKSRIGFNLQLFDESSKPVDGQVDVLVLGYGRERPSSI